MERLKKLLAPKPAYERIDDESHAATGDDAPSTRPQRFSLVVYIVFMLLGIAMLWAWNMFMAAAPYFQRRFKPSRTILNNFQASELSVAQIANLGSVLVLAKLQASASYPKRISSSLVINFICFSLLAISTKAFLGASAAMYLAFLLVTVFISSLATGLMQNGTFSFAASFRNPTYMQATMLGQAVAGVLPPLVQMISVLSSASGSPDGAQSSTSAFSYFMAAVGVTALTFVAFIYLLATHRPPVVTATSVNNAVSASVEANGDDDGDHAPQRNTNPAQQTKSVSLWYLAKRLFYPWTAVFITFGITMVFPVFTQEILTTHPDPPPYLRDAAFIPLALLVWNAGDLIGRLIPLAPALSLAHRPKILLLLAVLRAVWIPLYLACNIQHAEAEPSVAAARRTGAMGDLFYMLVVQLPFGITNGYSGSCCMMGAGDFVEDSEKEAAGGFMGLMLVAGLTLGSFASFLVGNV